MTAIETFTTYDTSLAAGDLPAVAAMLAPDVIWHQPGGNPLSGRKVGPEGVLAHLGRFFELSGGTFRLVTRTAVANGDLVVATVEFSAQREGRTPLAQSGIDVFRIADGLIAEVWLFSEDQAAEDEFWS
ncbi:nuclear transport factor 2 family protein [Pseudoclavibacter sp. RFBA6]|uniref:nuclear transport factor 2 family protein n=1 Tax=Pseudoclavibacter sp. RFBA6 TaxID=2080573 RepID=UPI000CE81178|nr:nuclear transport factor 2 family protein [Pseudoclavibacter sp. RFBA6]PPG40077.1 nuclear transport factor 2 family protein [Pseudoclavibacter sp. RFBA6]